MITVRVPAEIRKYKESLFFGLNARQVVSVIVTAGICIPLYYFGKNTINEELLSWLIMFIATPSLAFGFFSFRDLPFEKFCIAIYHFFVNPPKRKYVSVNAFQIWDKKARKEELPKSKSEQEEERKISREKSFEWCVFAEEADEDGCIWELSKSEMNFETVKENKKKRKNKIKERKEIVHKKSKLQIKAEELEEKIRTDKHYVPTKKDTRIRKKWNDQKEKQRKKDMIAHKKSVVKKNGELEKRRKATSTIPKSTQETIPYIADYEEGMFEVQPNRYSKVYRLTDINYKIADQEEQMKIFVRYCEFLNYFSDDIRLSLCVDNRIVSKDEQERGVLYAMTGDSYDRHREEYNSIMRRQIDAGNNDIQKEKFITVTIDADTPLEALLQFHKIDAEVLDNLRRIGCRGHVLSTEDRLSYYHDKFRKGREGELNIDFDFLKHCGISSKDYIAPSAFEFSAQDFRIDDTYCRVLFICNLPSTLSDEFLLDVCDNEFPTTMTLNIQPVAQEKGMKIVRRQLTGIEKDKLDAEKKAIKAGYSPDTIRHQIKDAHTTALTLYEDMLYNNQKMYFVTMTVMVQADTQDDLNQRAKNIESKARKFMAQMLPLTFQQEEGMKITLPFGYTPVQILTNRTLTTESLSVFMPFCNTELYEKGGYYYGLNQISHNLVLVNRLKMKTPSGFVLGKSGSGKSFATKREILNVLLHDSDTNVLIIDPENEYGDFCRVFGGIALKISTDTDNYINPMEMAEDYGLDEGDAEDIPLSKKKEKAIRKKSDYIMTIIERMLSSGVDDTATMLTPVQRTIVDRCVTRCYQNYLDHDFDMKYLPTLIDLQKELDEEMKIGGDDAAFVSQGVAYFTYGNMDVFSHQSNVDVNNRIVVFNVLNLGEQLKQIALIIVFDFIWNRMVQNKARGVRTYCYCDEIHVMFQTYYSANFLKQLYKRGRKFGLCITGITQNVEDLLRSEQARGMIGNSEYILMLSQNSEDAKILAELLSISETQMKYILNADAGSGLIFAEGAIVPFIDQFPTDSYLYKLMSTKFDDKMSEDEVNALINEIVEEHNKQTEDIEETNSDGTDITVELDYSMLDSMFVN